MPLRAQKNYKKKLTIHPDELDDDVKIVFESLKGSGQLIKLCTEAIIKTEKILAADEIEADEVAADEAAADEVPCDSVPPVRDGFIVFGEATQRQPLGDRSNDRSVELPNAKCTAEEQLKLAMARVAAEKKAADAARVAAAAKEAALAKEADAAKEAANALKTRAKDLWEAKLVYTADLPEPALPAYGVDAVLGGLVLIPARKYPLHAKEHAEKRTDFLGWAGKLIAFECRKSKVKVKVHGDQHYEHLPVKGSSLYAIEKLVRLA